MGMKAYLSCTEAYLSCKTHLSYKKHIWVARYLICKKHMNDCEPMRGVNATKMHRKKGIVEVQQADIWFRFRTGSNQFTKWVLHSELWTGPKVQFSQNPWTLNWTLVRFRKVQVWTLVQNWTTVTLFPKTIDLKNFTCNLIWWCKHSTSMSFLLTALYPAT